MENKSQYLKVSRRLCGSTASEDLVVVQRPGEDPVMVQRPGEDLVMVQRPGEDLETWYSYK